MGLSLRMKEALHQSVLLRETIDALRPRDEGFYLDCTGGVGGHSAEILKCLSDKANLWICDTDEEAVTRLKKRFAADKRVRVLHSRFSEVFDLLNAEGIKGLDGIVADLGVSSPQLDQAERGFSFLKEAPLDMRMDHRQEIRAVDIIQTKDEEELADLIFNFGEEKHAKLLARKIKEDQNLIKTTKDLASLAERVLGRFYKRQRIHPATRLFQALRIEVNQELEELKTLLGLIPNFLKERGRAVILSFHSLEDRLVKQKFKSLKEEGWQLLTKKPIMPSESEIEANPRSRSVKLRAIERDSHS